MKLEFNSKGFKEILNSQGVNELVSNTAQEISDKANTNYGGEGFQPRVLQGYYGGGRWIGFVQSTDKESSAAESEEQALTRATT